MNTAPDFYKGSSITIEMANKPYVDRTDYLPASAQDYRDADEVTIKIYDPCDELFVDCSMIKCPDRPYGWYMFRLQTDDEYPVGLYKVEIIVKNIVPEVYGACSTSTSGTGTSGTSGTSTSGTSGTGGASSLSSVASTYAVKYFRIIDRNIQ